MGAPILLKNKASLVKDGEQFLSCVSFEARSSGRASSFQLMGIRSPPAWRTDGWLLSRSNIKTSIWGKADISFGNPSVSPCRKQTKGTIEETSKVIASEVGQPAPVDVEGFQEGLGHSRGCWVALLWPRGGEGTIQPQPAAATAGAARETSPGSFGRCQKL